MSDLKEEGGLKDRLLTPIKRGAFLKYAGATAAVTTLVMAGCDDDDKSNPSTTGVDLGSGDTGVLNYAYALEQLEAAFYITVVADSSFSTTFNDEERAILTDIRDHEIVHRDFLKAALGTKAIADLEVDFSSINFKNKASVLETAKAFEDLGVSAYNGAGKLIADVNYLLIAGKIVSVEARHAAAIRDLLNPKSADFSGDDVVSVAAGLDGAKSPTEVLAVAGTYVKTKINASNLPTS